MLFNPKYVVWDAALNSQSVLRFILTVEKDVAQDIPLRVVLHPAAVKKKVMYCEWTDLNVA